MTVERNYPSAVLSDTKNDAFVSFLDVSRWVAAAIVCWGHLRNPLFVGFGDLPPHQQTLGIKAWFFVTGFHAEAVTIFFVLSGFLVGGMGLAKRSVGRLDLRRYAIDRVSRLYTAFLPALILGATLDLIGSQFAPAAGLYDLTQPIMASKVAAPAFTETMSLEIFVSNALMLQHFFSPTFGSNHPLWTISAEFWFYAIFGLGLLAADQTTRIRSRCAAAAVIAFTLFLLGPAFLLLFGLWMVGIVAAYTPAKLEQKWLALLTLAGLLVATRFSQAILDHDPTMRSIKDYAVATSFAWLLVSMRSSKSSFFARTLLLNRWLAGFSFSLYLIHFPLMIFVLSAAHDWFGWEGIREGLDPDARGILLYAVVGAILYAAAFGFSVLTERKTSNVRGWLDAKVARTFSASKEAR